MTSANLLAEFQRDWRVLVERSSQRVRGWWNEPALAGSADLAEVLARVRVTPDQVLSALLRLGQDGDRLAFRVVVQAMLPKAVRLSRGRAGDLSIAVSELWLAISAYPVDRRPRSIATNLAWAMARGLGRERFAPLPVDLLDEGSAVTPAWAEPDAASTLADARALGLIDERTHRTLWTVYVAGFTSPEAARLLDTTPELVRYRCSRALRRLREHAELLAA